ncbi:IclR family transcriptional regulator [Sphingobium phenoxybenzoativorans]|uniref:IclR family transcriptional regulator n=1 Tax=Sphingobium phenoxybenzoativorans TaxID=1592790 RepID=A0A975KAI5_9SPHN|nr:IclR family transcriptional regulator [Sphingobium phenoxybenzoativorans]QUT07831.1 IclR family transcriptional regulator [Sphingobium phenoxybenzoativorans]
MKTNTPSNPPPPRIDRELARAVENSKAPAISRAAAVLRLLGKHDAPIGVHAIARELGLVPSTCLHVLRALVAEELVAFDDNTKRYSLDAGVLTLARQWLRQNHFTEMAQPHLDRIANNFGVTLLGVRIVGTEHIIAVALSRSSSNFQISTQIGSRFPALVSATGRCIAAFGGHAREDLEAGFRSLRWDDAPSLEQWWEEVDRTRELGFAVDSGNYMSGVTVMSAPVWGNGRRLNHALVAIGISSTIRDEKMERLQDEVLASAQALSKQLSGEEI